MTTRHSIRGSRWARVAAAVGIAALPACVVWSAFDGPGWVDDGPSYRFVTLSALGALVAAFAAVSLAGIQTLSGESFGLFTSRRPLVAVLLMGVMTALVTVRVRPSSGTRQPAA